MSDLRELYQELILDHGRQPRNCKRLERASHEALGHNPLCGDRLQVFVEVLGDTVRDVSFLGTGCAISTASASLMTEALKGKSLAEAEALFRGFHAMLTGPSAPDAARLKKLAVFAGVRDFPVRVKCATLPWHTFHAALDKKSEAVSTE
ncbi:MAG: Fe-S cluster assembly sulfur transfer protein SufU [Planctomycetaceae bacterium]